MNKIESREGRLFEQISKLIDEAHKHVKSVVNTAMVYTYYSVGKYIVEDEQQGYERAAYGKSILKGLSEKLTDRYGKGWSVETLTKCRKFYLAYGISSAPQTKSSSVEIVRNADELPTFTLSWNHYLF